MSLPRELLPSEDRDEEDGWSRRYPVSFWVPVAKLPPSVSEVLLNAVFVKSEDDLERLGTLEHRRQEAVLRNEEVRVMMTDKEIEKANETRREATAEWLRDAYNSLYKGLDKGIGMSSDKHAQRAEIALRLTELWHEQNFR